MPFFRKWAGTAWAGCSPICPMRTGPTPVLPRELAAEEIRRLKREAMLMPIIFGVSCRTEGQENELRTSSESGRWLSGAERSPRPAHGATCENSSGGARR